MKPSRLRSVFLAKARGQALVIAVLVLMAFIPFTLLVVEVAERWLEVVMVEDALQHATRSAVQTIDYAPLAEGRDQIRATGVCERVSTAQARGGACEAVIEVADTFFRTNLLGVRGLVGASDAAARDAAAREVLWSVYPNGGSCAFSNGDAVAYEATPLICAEIRPTMRGIVGWGTYTPLIVAADRLDPVQP